MIGPFDRSVFKRALLVAVVAAAVGLVVIAATDEGGGWGARLGTWAATAPLAGSIGAAVAVWIARSRGELTALAALGATPFRARRGAPLGGSIVALAGAALALLPRVRLDALFPAPVRAHAFEIRSAAVIDRTIGLLISPDGSIAAAAPNAAAQPDSAAARSFAVFAIAALAIAGPFWASAPASPALRIISGPVALFVTVAAFQAVAQGRAPAGALFAGPIVLAASAAVAHRFQRGSRAPAEAS